MSTDSPLPHLIRFLYPKRSWRQVTSLTASSSCRFLSSSICMAIKRSISCLCRCSTSLAASACRTNSKFHHALVIKLFFPLRYCPYTHNKQRCHDEICLPIKLLSCCHVIFTPNTHDTQRCLQEIHLYNNVYRTASGIILAHLSDTQ